MHSMISSVEPHPKREDHQISVFDRILFYTQSDRDG